MAIGRGRARDLTISGYVVALRMTVARQRPFVMGGKG